jgi:CheY-like chemotaxis protein
LGWGRRYATPRRVLIIEDDEGVRTAMAEILAFEGHFVAEAENGIQALRIAREQRPDLILLDLMMPTMDGWAFRAAQQADPELAGIPVVVVSATLSEQVHAIGAVAHLHKPFDLEELLGVVDEHASAA